MKSREGRETIRGAEFRVANKRSAPKTLNNLDLSLYRIKSFAYLNSELLRFRSTFVNEFKVQSEIGSLSNASRCSFHPN